MLDYYEHKLILRFHDDESLRRHMKRIIEDEGFMSGGKKGFGEYQFWKEITKEEYYALKERRKDSNVTDFTIKTNEINHAKGSLFTVTERRVAW